MPAFDTQPTLADGRVRLRPLREADRLAVRAAAADPLIWEQHNDTSRYGPTFARYFDDNLASGGGLAIEDARSGQVVGLTRLQLLAGVDDAVEVGWTFLRRDRWGTGDNRAAKRLLVEHAGQDSRRVLLFIYDRNLRSRRAAEKLGGRLVGADDPPGWHPRRSDRVVYVLPQGIA